VKISYLGNSVPSDTLGMHVNAFQMQTQVQEVSPFFCWCWRHKV